jgi:hypothetical protein
MKRVLPPPDQSQGLDLPARSVIAWHGERAKAPGRPVPVSKWRESGQPLFDADESDGDDEDDDEIRDAEPQ